MKILLVHTYGLGDMIMATPAIMKLVACYPEAKIDLLIFQKHAEAPLVNAPFLGKIYYCDFFPANILKTIVKLRTRWYDLALHTSGTSVWKISLLMLSLSASRKVGEFATFRLPWYSFQRRIAEGEHRVLSNIQLVETFCDKSVDEKPCFFLSSQSILFTDGFMRENGLDNKRVIAIHPGCNEKFDNKRWEVQKYINLVYNLLNGMEDVAVLIIVGPEEVAEGKIIKKALPQTILVQESLQNVAALISKIDLMITNDSGLGHVASCFDTPVVTIFSKNSHAYPWKIKPYLQASCTIDFREIEREDEVSTVLETIKRIMR